MPLSHTYLVLGSQRTGSSMMMAALHAGGLPVWPVEDDQDKMNAAFGDEEYQPNPTGFWELPKAEYRAADFPVKQKGHLIKVLNDRCLTLSAAAGPYRAVFMMRDPEEMRQSWHAAFGRDTEHPLWKKYKTADRIRHFMLHLLDKLRQRRDMDVCHMWYRSVIAHPDLAFRALRHRGWPIDCAKAQAVVNPDLCRFRREELILGV